MMTVKVRIDGHMEACAEVRNAPDLAPVSDYWALVAKIVVLVLGQLAKDRGAA